jgi:hypothetical protein
MVTGVVAAIGVIGATVRGGAAVMFREEGIREIQDL